MEGIDLDGIVDLLVQSRYKKIVLQFSSSLLSASVSICQRISSQLPSDMKTYVVANSSMDNAIDDVAAMHVSADIIVYFGILLQVSSPFRVIMAIPSLPLTDIKYCVSKISSVLLEHKHIKRILLWADLEFYWAAVRLSYLLPLSVTLGQLPPQADLVNWKGNYDNYDKRERVGGLFLPENATERLNSESTEDVCAIVFLGDPQSKALQSLSLRFPERISIIYSPIDGSVEREGGRGVHARWGGIARVEKAKCIGIIVSTMGVDRTIVHTVLTRLQRLIIASKRTYYTFLMGRVTESKVLNFPIVDLYVFLAPEDVSLLPPKTFPVPIITPYELEVGLGAREWGGVLSDHASLLALDVYAAIRNIDAARRLREGDDDEDEGEGDQEGDNAGGGGSRGGGAAPVSLIDMAALRAQYSNNTSSNAETAVQVQGSRDLVLFESSAADFFRGQTFQGLDEEMDEADRQDVRIHKGQRGIATSYQVVKDIEDI
eukprot:gene29025-35034_t